MSILVRIHDTKNSGNEYKLINDSLIETHNKQIVYETFLNQYTHRKQDVVLEFIYPNHKEYLLTLEEQ